MYETIIDTNQTEKIEKYKTGIPKMTPSISKISKNGRLNTISNAKEMMTSFCSCRFFMVRCY